MMLCHCTLIVWSGSLTRSVSSESTSSNVNKTDKFVTLVDPKANVSQLSEARLLHPFLPKRETSVMNVIGQIMPGLYMLINIPMFLWSLLTPVQIIEEVLKNNQPNLNAIDYFGARLDMYLKNRNANNS
uniref:Uncharacterized protein n=1 Tax=Tetranychus urticae TaxID=32264 RepID=T1KH28_TETUR